ncbi:viperin family antiviral radical SAM protein [Pseudoalteromonas sp. H105]|uniref:viperin family antiviral radical SAM protein n=1 Tax=Pseudoalteromonas sp. H105 TaxID=1348393 RepID=UPI000732167D|nr:viperin family antiviral radical SAM protein [Pseudoalteromonas sp. H105]KTF16020.1 radical SAM protein [Pseudoalteromonas sp. H105]
MKNDTTNKPYINELVINWHITEACNYNCTYCFAKWGKPNELHRSLESIEKLLDELASHFIKGSSSFKEKLGYESVRLNIAGGEPMMLGSTFSIVLMLAKQKGFQTSIITNGSYLLNEKFDIPKNTLDMVGISFDSQDYDIRQRIGRVDRKGNSLSSDELKLALSKLEKTQKGIKTKINTVVNQYNWQEDFSSLISEINPYKWKVLHVMPYGDDDLLISNGQFNSFVDKHLGRDLPVYAESNSAMTESYLMIDPKGRFYQNSSGGSGYKYSECINDVGAGKALEQINFNHAVFIARYFPVEGISIVENEGAA